MTEKKSVKKDSAMVSYILGIISIVMSFTMSIAGLIFGIIGLIQSKKSKEDLSKKAKIYNIIGIILSIIFLIIAIAINYLAYNGTLNALLSK